MKKLDNGIALTWLGHATFHIRTPEGKEVLVDPWLEGNPSCPEPWKGMERGAHALICTHGHFDHIGDAVAFARKHDPEQVVGIFELCHWLESKGVRNTSPMNKGGSQEVAGLRAIMTHAVHSCGIMDEGRLVYGGEACGYVMEFSNGYRIYHAGDTAVFSDMALIGELYRPDLALLPIGDRFTMGPREAAKAIRLLGVGKVVPMHFATFELLRGTPEELARETEDIRGLEILTLEPGETLE